MAGRALGECRARLLRRPRLPIEVAHDLGQRLDGMQRLQVDFLEGAQPKPLGDDRELGFEHAGSPGLSEGSPTILSLPSGAAAVTHPLRTGHRVVRRYCARSRTPPISTPPKHVCACTTVTFRPARPRGSG